MLRSSVPLRVLASTSAGVHASMQLETALAGAVYTDRMAVDGVAGAAWKVCLDVYILDADGALLDACLLAAAAALLSVRLPPAQASGKGDEVCCQSQQE